MLGAYRRDEVIYKKERHISRRVDDGDNVAVTKGTSSRIERVGGPSNFLWDVCPL